MTLSTLGSPPADSRTTFKRWFDYLVKGEPLNATQTVEIESPREHQAGSELWVRSATKAEYDAFLNYLNTKNIEAFGRSKSSSTKNTFLDKAETNIRDSIKMLGYSKQPESAHVISGILTQIVEIINLVSSYKEKGLALPGSEVLTLDRSSRDVYLAANTLLKAITRKDTSILDQWKDLASKVENKKSPANMKYDIAPIRPFNQTGQTIQRILTALKTVDTSFLNVEDKYILQEIEETYLPNIYNAALSLKNSEHSIIQDVEKDFTIQLQFIETEIERIKHVLQERAIDIVKKQTNFTIAKAKARNQVSDFNDR
jgi:hypothetical protein